MDCECCVCFETFPVLHRFQCNHQICYACGMRLREDNGSYYRRRESGFKCPLCRSVSDKLLPPAMKDCCPFLDIEDTRMTTIVQSDESLHQEAIDYLMRNMQQDLPLRKKMYLVDLCRRKGPGALVACAISHDYNGDIRYENVNTAIRHHLDHPLFARDASFSAQAKSHEICPLFVSNDKFFDPVMGIARTNIETYAKKMPSRKVPHPHKQREEITVERLEKFLVYQGIDLLHSTVETVEGYRFNAIQWCVYCRHFVDGEPLINLCADLPMKATLLAVASIQMMDELKGTDCIALYQYSWETWKLRDLEERFGILFSMVECAKYLSSLMKKEKTLDIAVAYKRWPSQPYLNVSIPCRKHPFSEVLTFVLEHSCFHVVREGYILRYV